MNIEKVLIKYHKLIIVVFGLLLVLFFNPFALEKRGVSKYYKEYYTASVTNKYYDFMTRQDRIIEVKNVETGVPFSFCTLNDNEFIYDVVEIGDTIRKLENSFYIIIKNGKKEVKCFIGENSGTHFKYE